MTVVAVVADLILASRIEEAARAAGADFRRIDDPADLPSASAVDLAVVDWSARRSGWDELLSAWRTDAADGSRLVLFGQHTDLEAHAAARAAGLGPMWARSKLVAELPNLVSRVAGTANAGRPPGTRG